MANCISDDVKNLSVGIIGCGWLGKALAANLKEQGISLLATSSKQENVERLNAQSINAEQLSLPESSLKLAEHNVFLQHSLVISITPQFKHKKADYAEKVIQLVNLAQKKGVVQHIVLLSSSAVYGGLEGSVNEENSLNMVTEKVKILNDAEQAVLNFSKQGAQQGNVIRLAGLVGPERHPGKFLLAKKTLSNSLAPVNLIHQQDAVGLITALLQSKLSGEIINGVSDTHVSKQQYYQAAAKALKLQSPLFEPSNESQTQVISTTRIVSGNKAKNVLPYKFIYPDLLTWL